MRPTLHWLVLTIALAAGCARPAPARDEAAPPARPPFAVVELFTSEGCSSCPPADRHLAEIEAAAGREHENVFVLSFHVDYWDYLGWKDPFSDPRHSERQQSYARAQSFNHRAGQKVMVARGENAGHALSHRGVVRAFVSRELDAETRGSVALDLPAGVALARAKLVAFATDRRNLTIVGAGAVSLGR